MCWRRLFPGIAGLVAQFQFRLFPFVQALIFGVPVGFLVLYFEVFGTCRSGFGVFFPCDIGANHCRLRHIGWERCGHGLTSRPRESASEDFFNRLLVLFGYPDGSAAALLAGVLLLRYCSARFACKLPTWRLPDRGHVCDLVTEGVDGARVLRDDGISRDLFPHSVGRAGGFFENRVLGGFKRIRLNRKTPAHLARFGNLEGLQSRSRVWKRLRVSGAHWCSVCDSHVLHECHHSGAGSSLGYRVGVG